MNNLLVHANTNYSWKPDFWGMVRGTGAKPNNFFRRFNRRVLQSGVLAEAKATMRFEKPISKRERRQKAIVRRERKADKAAKARLGIR